MTVKRLLPRKEADGDDEGQARPMALPMAEYLDLMEHERAVIIMRLRYIDRLLVRNGRLRKTTLPEKTR